MKYFHIWSMAVASLKWEYWAKYGPKSFLGGVEEEKRLFGDGLTPEAAFDIMVKGLDK